MPCFDGEMFGVTKVPNGVTRLRPPASTSLASPLAPGAAWQACAASLPEDAHAALRVTRGCRGEPRRIDMGRGRQRNQNPAPPTSASRRTSNPSLRIMLESDLLRSQPDEGRVILRTGAQWTSSP